VGRTRFWYNQYAQNRKIGKPNNLKVFENHKTKGPKQDIQNQLRSHVLEGENPSFDQNYSV